MLNSLSKVTGTLIAISLFRRFRAYERAPNFIYLLDFYEKNLHVKIKFGQAWREGVIVSGKIRVLSSGSY